MKSNKKTKLLLVLLSTMLLSCNNQGNTSSSSTIGATTSDVSSSIDSTTSQDTSSEDSSSVFPDVETITIAQALEICGNEPSDPTTERYYIKATIKEISDYTYGSMVLEDETGKIEVYGTYSEDGSLKFSELEDKPKKGDIILVHCTLSNYQGTKQVHNARLIAFEHVEIDIDISNYQEMNISEARNATKGTLIKTSGVVAKILYADGMKAIGVFLVDNTQSIYVYSDEVANSVKVGNTITIVGEKDYYVLSSEQSSADKFSYKGCNQITEAILIENDNLTTEFNTDWVKESSIKEILDTPVSEDITTTMYKVNGLIKKEEGKGFTNYYIYDIDGKTSSYTYSQASGEDFSWLDEFDGKICTIYLSPLNAKCSSTGAFFRFLPVKVIDENYTFDMNEASEVAVEYGAVDQFDSTFDVGVNMKLVDKVSNDLLGFQDVSITYSSSDTSVLDIVIENGIPRLKCYKEGTAIVTVTGTHNGNVYNKEVEVSVNPYVEYESVNVQGAIDASVDSEVIVKGIVGPSIVNKSGFYLIDETGVIAVLVNDATMFNNLEIGNEVTIRATRENYSKGGTTYFGQTSLVDAVVLVNDRDNHEYSTSSFITDKTLKDFYNLNVLEDHTTDVYVVKGTIEVTETPYYTSIAIKDGETNVSLYSSSAEQYEWLFAYSGQEITMEIVACNWNDKTYYRGCVLAVYDEDGKVFNTLNFDA